jgi:hypothetical protein
VAFAQERHQGQPDLGVLTDDDSLDVADGPLCRFLDVQGALLVARFGRLTIPQPAVARFRSR